MPPPSRRSNLERKVPLTIAALFASVGAGLSGASPTGLAVWDVMLCVMFALLTVAASATAPRQASLVFVTIATVLTAFGLWMLVGLIGIALGAASFTLERRDRVLGGIIGAIGVQLLLRWPPLWIFGFPSVVATVLTLYLFWNAYSYSRRRSRTWVRRSLAVTVSLVALLLAGFSASVIRARIEVDRGVDAARTGLAAVRAGDTTAIGFELRTAEQALGNAGQTLNSPLLKPVRLLPVIGQHQRALATATTQGREVAGAARTAADVANLDEVSLTGGQLDLAVLTNAAPYLQSTAAALSEAVETVGDSSSVWLLSPLKTRVDSLLAELKATQPEIQMSADAAAILPQMLGAESPQRYLVLVGNPGESRELGGFVAGYALAEFDQGRIRRVSSGRVTELYEVSRAGLLDHPSGYPPSFAQRNPAFWPQNLTDTPDMKDVHRAVQDIFPELDGAPIDGTVYLDPGTIARIVELTGPIEVEGVGYPLNAENVEDFLYREQYLLFDSAADRFGALVATLNATFEALSRANLPGPERLGNVLGPSARSGRLQVATSDLAVNEFLRSTRLLSDFAPDSNDDFLAVVQTNGASNKLDTYLYREIDYAVQQSETGSLKATVTVTLHSAVPTDAPPYTLGEDGSTTVAGQSRVVLSVYSPHQLTALRLNGVAQIPARQRETYAWRYTQPVLLDPNSSHVVEFDLQSTEDLGSDYRLHLRSQPLVNADQFRLDYSNSDGSVGRVDTFFATDLVIESDGSVSQR